MSDNIKVAHLSNIANVGYMNVTALRARKVDARLYYNPADPYGISNPLWEEKGLEGKHKEWLIEWKVKKNLLNPFYHLRFINEFKRFDLLHAYTLSPIYALLSGTSYIAQTTGADINEVSKEKSVLGSLYRLALKKAAVVLFSNFNQLPRIKELGLKNSRFIPFSIDTDKYTSSGTKHGDGIVFLHSSRLDWKSKGNDKFFRAFSRFVKENPSAVVNVLSAGPDTENTVKLVNGLGISANVKFSPAVKKEELLALYRSSDVIVDQFVVGGFGINALEAMSSAKPVLIYCNNECARECYGDIPPVLNASSEEEILSCMRASLDRIYLAKLGADARRWVLKHHDSNKVAEMLIGIYESVLKEKKRCG